MVVQALGSEWHAECFVCMVGVPFNPVQSIDQVLTTLQECGGDFENGQYFLRGDDETPVCVRCEERRLKG
jgi:hypothetical protein